MLRNPRLLSGAVRLNQYTIDKSTGTTKFRHQVGSENENMKSIQSQACKLVALVAGVLVFSLSLQAQTQPSKAEVRAVKGTATYTVGGGPAQPLKVGTILPAGSVVKTSAG